MATRNPLDGERARGLVHHERRHFAEHAAEFLRLRSFVPKPGQVVLHQGCEMIVTPFTMQKGRRQKVKLAGL